MSEPSSRHDGGPDTSGFRTPMAEECFQLCSIGHTESRAHDSQYCQNRLRLTSNTCQVDPRCWVLSQHPPFHDTRAHRIALPLPGHAHLSFPPLISALLRLYKPINRIRLVGDMLLILRAHSWGTRTGNSVLLVTENPASLSSELPGAILFSLWRHGLGPQVVSRPPNFNP